MVSCEPGVVRTVGALVLITAGLMHYADLNGGGAYHVHATRRKLV